MTKAEAQTKFKARLIPWGMRLMNRAEAVGVDWQTIPIEKLEAAVIFAEAFATPDEYKNDYGGGEPHKKRLIAKA